MVGNFYGYTFFTKQAKNSILEIFAVGKSGIRKLGSGMAKS